MQNAESQLEMIKSKVGGLIEASCVRACGVSLPRAEAPTTE